jgi:hypothetical protein
MHEPFWVIVEAKRLNGELARVSDEVARPQRSRRKTQPAWERADGAQRPGSCAAGPAFAWIGAAVVGWKQTLGYRTPPLSMTRPCVFNRRVRKRRATSGPLPAEQKQQVKDFRGSDSAGFPAKTPKA